MARAMLVAMVAALNMSSTASLTPIIQTAIAVERSHQERVEGASVTGKVVARDTGQPLHRSEVTLVSANGRFRKTAYANEAGIYEFTNVPEGEYLVGAKKTRYVAWQFGQRYAYGRGISLKVSRGQHLTQVDLALFLESVIAGRVFDRWGDAVPRAYVQALRLRYGIDGKQRLVSAQGGHSDDRGDFRLFGLSPGQYVVSVRSRIGSASPQADRAADDDTAALTYYPGSPNPSGAQTVVLGLGDQQSIDMTLMSQRLATIRGVVVGSGGSPLSGAELRLVTSRGARDGLYTVGHTVADGSFVLQDIPPDDYVLDVRAISPRQEYLAEFAAVPIKVDVGDVNDLQVITRRALAVIGHVQYEGSARQLSRDDIRVEVTAAELDRLPMVPSSKTTAHGMVDNAGRFRLSGIVGPFVVQVQTPQSVMVKSIVMNRRDVANVAIDPLDPISELMVVITDKVTKIVGEVSDGHGNKIPNSLVIIQPASSGIARAIKILHADERGTFQHTGIQPGQYIATAVEYLEPDGAFVPETQDYLRREGQPFDVSDGQTVFLRLPVQTNSRVLR
jgi:hypothetical protein